MKESFVFWIMGFAAAGAVLVGVLVLLTVLWVATIVWMRIKLNRAKWWLRSRNGYETWYRSISINIFDQAYLRDDGGMNVYFMEDVDICPGSSIRLNPGDPWPMLKGNPPPGWGTR